MRLTTPLTFLNGSLNNIWEMHDFNYHFQKFIGNKNGLIIQTGFIAIFLKVNENKFTIQLNAIKDKTI